MSDCRYTFKNKHCRKNNQLKVIVSYKKNINKIIIIIVMSTYKYPNNIISQKIDSD